MNYFFLHNKILCFAEDIREAIPEAELLTDEQVSFYEANKKANKNVSVGEVRNCKLTEVIQIVLSADEQRKRAYSFETCVNWQDKRITIDTANSLYLYYIAEGDNDRAEEIQTEIKAAKTEIRNRYK